MQERTTVMRDWLHLGDQPMLQTKTTLRNWIITLRPHTAALTVSGGLLAVYLSPHPSWNDYLAIGWWCLFYHIFGFLDNGICDLPFDQRDPEKAHFPLVSGRISVKAATWFWWVGTLLTAAWGLAMTVGAAIEAQLFLLCAVIFGALYNRTAKTSLLGALWISTAFASIPGYAFIVAGGDPYAPELQYIVAYAWILMLGQIAVSGFIKDATSGNGEANLLVALGLRTKPTSEGSFVYEFGARARWFAWAVRFPLWAMALAWGFAGRAGVAAPLLLGIVAPLLWWSLLEDGESSRRHKVAVMALSEVLGYWFLVWSLSGGMPWVVFSAFAVGPLVWFVAINKFLWNTWIAPKV